MGKRRQSPSPAGNQSHVSSPKRRQTNTPQPMPLAPRNIYPPRQTRAQAQSSANTPHPTSPAPRSINPSRQTQVQAQTSTGTSAATSATISTASTTTTFATAATATTSATDTTKITRTMKAAKFFKITIAPSASAPMANAPRVSAPITSGAPNAASVAVKPAPKKRARIPNNRKHTEKYRLAAKELAYDTFMLSHQETEPQQGESQDSRLAELNAVRQREEDLVANLQSSSNCLADNTRDVYRIIFVDYKKLCNDNYSSETFRRYEVKPRKALAYLRYLYAQRTPKHIGPTPAVRRIFLDRETVKANRVPIEGAMEFVDLARYVDAEEAAGRASCRADGGRTIYNPYSYSKIEHGYAALNTLQKLQAR
ncbi:hypothetical protein BG015_004404, partial [Linnemannia schmuckeri]